MTARLMGASLAALFVSTLPANAEAPRVVASIAPVHSLVASVMEGAGAPELLITSNVSPHDFALRPSDLRKIANADLVVWIGESLETYLVRPLETEGAPHLELLEAEGVDAHPYDEEEDAHDEHAAHGDHAHDEHGHDEHAAEEEHAAHDEHGHDEHGHDEHAEEEHAAHDDHGHGHDHFGLDPHIWLDPVRAAAIVNAVAERLAEIDPENAALYAANGAETVARLEALNADAAARLADHGDTPFVTFHDAYSYFVERYGLNQVGQLTVDPERRPGAATLRTLRETIQELGAACAFSEPQFDAAAVATLAGDADIRVGELDPLGFGIEPGPGLWEELFVKNTEAVVACLTASDA